VSAVVVTARRREERLNDVPIAASVETHVELQQRGAQLNTQSVLEGVPGLNFSSSNGADLSEFTIRGSGAAGTATGADAGVGLYRNNLFAEGGLYYGHNYGRADFFDVQQVEVLRGTQGALYGRDAVGGSVNVISARPEFNNGGYASVDYGSTVDSLEGQAVVNQKINDYVAVRLGFDAVDQQKGFLYDRSYGNYFDEDHGGVGRAQVRFDYGPLDMNLLVERQEEQAPSNEFQVDYPAGTPVAIAAGFPSGYVNPQYTRDSSINTVNINNVTNVIYNATYKFSWATLSENFSYRDLYTRTATDSDGFTAASLAANIAQYPANAGAAHTTTNLELQLRVNTVAYDDEVHLAGGDGRLTWLAGAEYLNLTSNLGSYQTALPAVLVNGASYEVWNSYAGFGSIGYDIIPKVLNLTAEGRYTDDDKYQARFNLGTSASGPSTVLAPGHYKQDNFSYDVTLGYHPWSEILAYLKVGTGYRAGGANSVPLAPSPPVPVAAQILYHDETSLEYEAGLKGSPTKNTFVGLSIYQTTTDGVIVSESNGCAAAPACAHLPFANFPNFLTNGGTANAWGVELEGKANYDLFSGHLSAGFTLSRQYGSIVSGPFKGFRLPQEPDWIQSIDLYYTHAFVAGSQAFGDINYHGQSGGTQDVSTPTFGLDTRNLVNLRFGLQKDHWEIAGYVNNLFDDKFRDAISVNGNLWDLGLRSGGVQLRYHW
jgi:iron complex outermembrane receptor protein